MASSAIALSADPPPTPPPTTCEVVQGGGSGGFTPGTSPIPRELNASRNQCLLPLIDSSAMVSVVKSDAHPTSTTNDFLPSDLLFSLKRMDNTGLQPIPRARTPVTPTSPRSPSSRGSGGGKGGGAMKTPRAPANVWTSPRIRGKLKHLTDAPPCICGAGKDISFLYDSAPVEKKETRKFVPSETLIPEEYHLVKHPGVLGLEFFDKEYSVSNDPHKYHMTVFPSMKPTGRHEVLTLKHTLDSMLRRAGIPKNIADSDLNGPTEMHNLLELIEKEQTIYNVIFHELIRQVSVQCIERGQLLAEIRRRYANILNRIPRQVKSLHDHTVAQRTLDRKLTEELHKFRSKIATLTEELCLVKQHDLHVTEQSKVSEESLSTALASSQKSAEMLNEYHELYEMQRRRLEEVVTQLSEDQEQWKRASYDLSFRVAKEYDLQTLQRMQLNEKSWTKLAGHFAILLSSKDTEQLSEIQEYIQEWKVKLKMFVFNLTKMESTMKERLIKVKDGFTKWIEAHKKCDKSDTGELMVPPPKQLGVLWAEMKLWLGIINTEAENFSGENLIANLEAIKELSALVDKWSDISSNIFSRHQKARLATPTRGREQGGASTSATPSPGRVSPGWDLGAKEARLSIVSEGRASVNLESTAVPSSEDLAQEAKIELQYMKMIRLRRGIEERLGVYEKRATGDNGVATGFVHLSTALEAWDTKFSLLFTSAKRCSLASLDWIKLGKLLVDWREKIEDIIDMIGSVPPTLSVSSWELDFDDSTTNLQKDESKGGEKPKVEISVGGEEKEKGDDRVGKEKKKGGKKEEEKGEGGSSTEDGEVEEGTTSATETSREGVIKVRRRSGGGEEEKKEETLMPDEGTLDGSVSLMSMPLENVFSEVESWASDLAYAIDNQDARWTQQVSRLHSDLVKWTVKLLLAMTRVEEQEKKMQEAGQEEGQEEGHPPTITVAGEEGEGTGKPLGHVESMVDLKNECIALAQTITSFTKQLNKSCIDVVREIVEQRTKEGYPNPEEEKLELQRMEDEAQELTMLAGLLVKKVQEGYVATRRGTLGRVEVGSEARGVTPAVKVENLLKDMAEKEKDGGSIASPVKVIVQDSSSPVSAEIEEQALLLEMEQERVPIKASDEMHIMGSDKNIHQKPVQKVIDEGTALPIASCTDLGLPTEESVPNGRGTTPDDAEKLVMQLDKMSAALKEEQEKSSELEQKVQAREKELEESRNRMADLEAEVRGLKQAAEAQVKRKGARTSGGSKTRGTGGKSGRH